MDSNTWVSIFVFAGLITSPEFELFETLVFVGEYETRGGERAELRGEDEDEEEEEEEWVFDFSAIAAK